MSVQALRSSRTVKPVQRFEVEDPLHSIPNDQAIMKWAMQTVVLDYIQAHTKGKHVVILPKSKMLDAGVQSQFLEATRRITSQLYATGCKPTPKKVSRMAIAPSWGCQVLLSHYTPRGASLLSLSLDLLQRLWPPERAIAGSLTCSVLRKALFSSSTVFQSKRHLEVGHISTHLAKRLSQANGDAIVKINLDPNSDDVIAEASQVLSEASKRGFKQLVHLELSMRRQPREKRTEASWGYTREEEGAKMREQEKDRSGFFEMSMNRLAVSLSSFGSLAHLSLGGLLLGEDATHVLLVHCRDIAALNHLDLRDNRRVHGSALHAMVLSCPSLRTLILDHSAVTAPSSSSSSSPSAEMPFSSEHERGALTTLSARNCRGFHTTVLKLIALCGASLERLDLSQNVFRKNFYARPPPDESDSQSQSDGEENEIESLFRPSRSRQLGEVLSGLSALSHLDISECGLDNECVGDLSAGFEASIHLRDLKLAGNRITKRGFQLLLAACKNLACLEFLGLRANPIEGGLPKGSGKLLKRLRSLAVLDMSATELLDCHLDSILAGCCPSLRVLKVGGKQPASGRADPLLVRWLDDSDSDLCRDELMQRRGVRLGKALQRLSSLEQFAAPALLGFERKGWAGLMGGLAHVRTLTALDLSFNDLEEGSQHIAIAVQAWPRLSQVRLDGCGLQAEGISRLMSGLAACSELTQLSLARNQLGVCAASTGLDALARGLLQLKASLKLLDLRDTGLGPEGVLRVAPALSECGALTALDLSDNAIADAGAETLAMHLPQNEALERLWLRGNKVGGLGAAALAGALAGMKGLKELDMGGNELRAAGAGFMSIGLCESRTLRRADLSRNNIGASGAESMGRVLCGRGCGVRELRVEGNLREEDEGKWESVRAALPMCEVTVRV